MEDQLTEEEQLKAPTGALFIPYSQFPPRKYRKDCFYHCTPAMLIPSCVENVHSCEVCSNNLFLICLINLIIVAMFLATCIGGFISFVNIPNIKFPHYSLTMRYLFDWSS